MISSLIMGIFIIFQSQCSQQCLSNEITWCMCHYAHESCNVKNTQGFCHVCALGVAWLGFFHCKCIGLN